MLKCENNNCEKDFAGRYILEWNHFRILNDISQQELLCQTLSKQFKIISKTYVNQKVNTRKRGRKWKQKYDGWRNNKVKIRSVVKKYYRNDS